VAREISLLNRFKKSKLVAGVAPKLRHRNVSLQVFDKIGELCRPKAAFRKAKSIPIAERVPRRSS
jgi:hypothetical protein